MRSLLTAGAIVALATTAADAQVTFSFVDVSGLSAEAEFWLADGGSTLMVRYRNLSTGVPGGFSNSDQILSGVSFDFGGLGQVAGDAQIIGGSVVIGAASFSVDFDSGAYGAGADVSGEFGYGNMDGTGAKENFVSSNTAGSTMFGGANLDGPVSIDGPQAGLISSAFSLPLGGLGAIQDEVVATLLLDTALTDLNFLSANEVRFEFGSDAAFFDVPTPSAAIVLGAGMLFARRRRR